MYANTGKAWDKKVTLVCTSRLTFDISLFQNRSRSLEESTHLAPGICLTFCCRPMDEHSHAAYSVDRISLSCFHALVIPTRKTRAPPRGSYLWGFETVTLHPSWQLSSHSDHRSAVAAMKSEKRVLTCQDIVSGRSCCVVVWAAAGRRSFSALSSTTCHLKCAMCICALMSRIPLTGSIVPRQGYSMG